MQCAVNTRLASALAGATALASAAFIQRNPGSLFERAWPAAIACAMLGAASLAGAVGGTRVRQCVAPTLALLRLSLVLFASATWRGEARELWGALAVWVAWRDALDGLSEARPLLPAAVALVASIALTATMPATPPGRVVLTGLVAALAAARGHALRMR